MVRLAINETIFDPLQTMGPKVNETFAPLKFPLLWFRSKYWIEFSSRFSAHSGFRVGTNESFSIDAQITNTVVLVFVITDVVKLDIFYVKRWIATKDSRWNRRYLTVVQKIAWIVQQVSSIMQSVSLIRINDLRHGGTGIEIQTRMESLIFFFRYSFNVEKKVINDVKRKSKKKKLSTTIVRITYPTLYKSVKPKSRYLSSKFYFHFLY